MTFRVTNRVRLASRELPGFPTFRPRDKTTVEDPVGRPPREFDVDGGTRENDVMNLPNKMIIIDINWYVK